jgi:hypothetical protein
MLNDFSFVTQRKVSLKRFFFCPKWAKKVREAVAYRLFCLRFHHQFNLRFRRDVAFYRVLKKNDKGDAER